MATAPGRKCTETNLDGTPCKAKPVAGAQICRSHTPIPDERRCTGTISGGYDHMDRAGEPCPNWAMTGQRVCRMHGGAARHNRQAAAARIAEEKLMAKATNLVGRPVDNPLTELANLAGRARAWMELLEERVQSLVEAQASEDAGDETAGIRYRGGAGEQIRGEIQLYERAMGQLGQLLTSIARLDIDTRLAAISAKQADAVIEAIDAALAAVAIHDPQQRSIAKSAAARRLRAS